MYALVENNQITKYLNGNKGITIGENQYPKSIFRLWTEEERNAIGIYTVQIDSTNKKNEEYYINTDITYAYADGVVTGSYGTPTAKNLDDTLYTAQDETDGLIPEGKSVGDVAADGLKTQHKRAIKQQAAGLLAPTDWYVVKASEVADYTVPADITTFRAAVRTKSNEMETMIDGAAEVDALAALYENTNTGTEENPSYSRPLGQFPESPVE